MDRDLAPLAAALTAAGLRHRVLAHNLANANTPGFKRFRVEFESRLAAALAAGQDPAGVTPAVVRETGSRSRPDGNNVDVELEMAQLAENQLWQAALVRQVSEHFARLRTVIYEGRR